MIAWGTCRDESERLWKALDGAREGEALQLLRETRHAKEIVYKRHPVSGAFVVHTAVDKNMQQLAHELANTERYPGVLQQVDGQGCVASCRGRRFFGLASASRLPDPALASLPWTTGACYSDVDVATTLR